MGKLKIVLVSLLVLYSFKGNAFWRVVCDPYCIAQVGVNMTMQKYIEEAHNVRLDSIRAKQERIMKYTTTMATIKELYKMSMQNITGFGEESKLYVEMFNTTVDIFKNVPIALNTLNKFPGKNHLLCLNEIQNLLLETEQCVVVFKDIVNNGKIKSPIPESNGYMPQIGGRYHAGQGDGYNFMDRYERYSLASKLLSTLESIKYRLQGIVLMCTYCNTMSQLVFNLDVDTWLSYFTLKNAAEGLINDWKGLDG